MTEETPRCSASVFESCTVVSVASSHSSPSCRWAVTICHCSCIALAVAAVLASPWLAAP